MKPSAPTSMIWLIGLILGIIGIVAHFIQIPTVTQNQFWFVGAGFILLAIGTSFKGI